MNTADVFVKALENEGVEYIFGLPGEENLFLLESIRKSEKIRFILTRNEQSAGFMAATYGRLTGKAGVCLATLGPGATNMVTPTAYAQLGAMPLVVITGQKPVHKRKQGLFQVVDIVNLMRPIVKMTRQITHGDQTPSVVREAFRLAQEERPGAVHIELPEDVAEQKQGDTPLFDVMKYYIPVASKQSLEKAGCMIAQAKRPLLLIGAGANRRRASVALTEFVNQVNIPFLNTQMGKGIVDERHPLFMGTAALSECDFLHDAIRHADLIINVGHDIIEKPPFLMKRGSNQKVLHINFFSVPVDDVYFPDLVVVGDIATTVSKITGMLSSSITEWRNGFYLELRNTVREKISMFSMDCRFPILPQRVVNIIRHTIPEDGIITLDNGIYKIWFSRSYQAYGPNTVLLDNALATMGAGLPSAIVAKMLNPEKVVISVCGDGGFMMNAQELETAVRLNLDLVIIILNDNAFGMIRWKQQEHNLDDFGLNFTNPDFVLYAKSFGANGYRPSSAVEFELTLRNVITAKGIHIIDLAVDYSLNNRMLNSVIRDYSSQNIYSCVSKKDKSDEKEQEL